MSKDLCAQADTQPRCLDADVLRGRLAGQGVVL